MNSGPLFAVLAWRALEESEAARAAEHRLRKVPAAPEPAPRAAHAAMRLTRRLLAAALVAAVLVVLLAAAAQASAG